MFLCGNEMVFCSQTLFPSSCFNSQLKVQICFICSRLFACSSAVVVVFFLYDICPTIKITLIWPLGFSVNGCKRMSVFLHSFPTFYPIRDAQKARSNNFGSFRILIRAKPSNENLRIPEKNAHKLTLVLTK